MAVRRTVRLLAIAVAAVAAGCSPTENVRQAPGEAGVDANAAERDAVGPGGAEGGVIRDGSVISERGMPSAAVPEAAAPEAAAPVPPCNAGATHEAGVSADAGIEPAPRPGPSCVGLCENCGPTANENCCTSLRVPGDSFYRSYDDVFFTDASYPATVSSFWLDKYEVTGGRFANFRAAWNAGWRPSAGAGKHTHLNGGSGLANSAEPGFEQGWDPAWDANVAPVAPVGLATDTYPYGGTNWYEAYAFCVWDGGFLPSEAEWNYAAAGGAEQRVFPWSVPPNSRVFDTTYFSCNLGPTGCGGPLAVGSSPAGNGRWGHSDLTGNIEEWTVDAYLSPYVLTCNDCSYLPSPAANRVRRGESFVVPTSYAMSVSFRYFGDPLSRVSGVRCARSP